ncbi:hypothetical protein PpBr36_00032 [Pyricularia pennisetigena]|uniref:hypothetical protein n=1 Tax=Pyricularia pennisetigena TaxID=1578925 RepID=UPI00114DBD49|nr:hypothetical protein PpBr36_00032 [Pyricularia pennisetigena]TLS28198.1 hypothetical protein PpBr36_00032 [Pyricularia pennisetigena]
MVCSSALFSCTLVSSLLGAATAVGEPRAPGGETSNIATVRTQRGPEVAIHLTVPRMLYLGDIRRPGDVLNAGGLRSSGRGKQDIPVTANFWEAQEKAMQLIGIANEAAVQSAKEPRAGMQLFSKPPRQTVDFGYIYHVDTTGIEEMFVRDTPRDAVSRTKPGDVFFQSDPREQFKATAPIPKSHIAGWYLVLPDGRTVYYENDDGQAVTAPRRGALAGLKGAPPHSYFVSPGYRNWSLSQNQDIPDTQGPNNVLHVDHLGSIAAEKGSRNADGFYAVVAAGLSDESKHGMVRRARVDVLGVLAVDGAGSHLALGHLQDRGAFEPQEDARAVGRADRPHVVTPLLEIERFVDADLRGERDFASSGSRGGCHSPAVNAQVLARLAVLDGTFDGDERHDCD